ncbi:MAG: cytochrome b/b6 domain-containing protein [Cyanobacteria bacterium]|nr:cytochrome b/b6 domain-containing protein [Cyanobacteriota bacterium]
MAKPAPFLPLALRLFHGTLAVATLGAIATALWTYDTYDGRWFRVHLPRWSEIEGLHGTFGLWALLLLPVFALYCFAQGRSRLVQDATVAQLGDFATPRGWFALHRLVNTAALLALTFAVFSGKMMDERWLPQGELDHGWYYAHLASWLVLVLAIAAHALMAAKVGGKSLLITMWTWRGGDRARLRNWGPAAMKIWRNNPGTVALRGLRDLWQRSPLVLRWVEGAIAIAWIGAWVLSITKELGR